MGNYLPAKPRRKRSLAETLAEAERDHFLDCPNADIWNRGAAFALDLILLLLIFSALDRLLSLLIVSQNFNATERLWGEWKLSFNAIKMAAEALVVYVVSLWSVAAYGGSPGKLLLGLRVIDTRTGETLSFPQTFLRELLGKFGLNALSLGIGLALPLFRKDQRALHDLISATVVKKVR